MKIQLEHQGKTYQCDTSLPIDISIPLKAGMETVNCFYAPFMDISPVMAGDFIGSTEKGGLVNFMNVRFNPHGNGTHTECVGHISKEKHTINQCLNKFWHSATLISVYPEKIGGDRIITKERIQDIIPANHFDAKAIIIRTYPNHIDKMKQHHSGANPPYVQDDAIHYLNQLGFEHLLIDLPSVDREEDGGALLSHKAFWSYPDQPQVHKTITELVYIPDQIKDGNYLLNIQIASFELDASPSKPILYHLEALLG